MKIEVGYDDFTGDTYASIQEATEAILEAHANGVEAERVVELDDAGNEVREYGCTWSVTLELLDE